MWWQVVFWLLLVPLIVIEFFLFLKTRKYSWLIFALAIFTYVVAVNYIIDVFDLGRNAIIIILLASAGVMVLIGRQLRKEASHPKAERIAALAIAALMIIIFVVSVIFGKAVETVTPASSIAAREIAYYPQDQQRSPKDAIPAPNSQVTILTRTVTNTFFLPVPIVQKNYRTCINTTQGVEEAGSYYDYSQENPEVKPGGTETIQVKISPVYLSNNTTPLALLVYQQSPSKYEPCATMVEKEPLYRIPVR